MRIYLSCLLVLSLNINAFTQDLPVIKGQPTITYDFSQEAKKKWDQTEALFQLLNTEERDWDSLTETEKALIGDFDETKMEFYAVVVGGCSWYCGAGEYAVNTSTYLKPSKTFSYKAHNLNDFDYETAWVEGKSGYGIGETIQFSFAPQHPRVTSIRIANGYVKSKAHWENNSRVKQLKMFINDTPFAILEFKDVYSEHEFPLEDPIGYGGDRDFDKLKHMPPWTIRFEILSVYKGKKYDDTAISEIYFDGIDVHCLAKGTLITMSDGHLKNIEDIQIGDSILSFNFKKNKAEPAIVTALAKPQHKDLIQVTFEDQSTLTCTSDHPFLTSLMQWTSISPSKTQRDYQLDAVLPLQIGTQLKTLTGAKKVVNVTKIKGIQQTYTIVNLNKNQTFIANGILTGIETLRPLKDCPKHPTR